MKRSIASALLSCLIMLTTAAQSDSPHDLDYYISHAPFTMPAVTLPPFPDHNFKLTDYGALPDGKTLNTEAFEKAITACSAAGGGHIIVPAGNWLTGPIRFQSNVDLHLEKGALVQLTKDHSQYPMIRASNKSTSIVTASPVYGYDLKNIAITGEGIIDGAGETWRPVKKGKTTPAQWSGLLASGGVVSKEGDLWWPTREAMDGEAYLKTLKGKSNPTPGDWLPARDFLRPYMVTFVNCDNILLRGVTLRNSPKFVFYPNSCTNMTLDGVNIFNEWWAQNGDGIDISACKNVVIYKCTVNAGDDGICMKSSGGKKDAPNDAKLENILVAGCTVYRAHGGFVLGSNTDGGMRNIYVADCNFIGTDIGLRFKSNAGRGGLVKDIFIDRISMRNIVHEAISFDTWYEDVPAGTIKQTSQAIPDKTPEFTAFHISNIVCEGAKAAIVITGLPQLPVHDIYFNNISITADKGITATDAATLHFSKTKIIAVSGPAYTFGKGVDKQTIIFE
jgi:polygalacturonase